MAIPGVRRPALLDRLLFAGLKGFVKDLDAKGWAALRRRVLAQITAAATEGLRTENRALRRRVAELERKLAERPVLSAKEAKKLDTLHRFGVDVPGLAKIFRLPEAGVRRLLGQKEAPNPRRRALDL